MEKNRFLIVASFPHNLISFRGPLMAALQIKGFEVHVAVPELPPGHVLRVQLESQGVVVHDVPMQRTGMNPIADLRTLGALWWLMRRLRPTQVLGYTVKPVIYGSLAAWLARVPHRYALITGLGYAFTAERTGALTQLVRWLYAVSLLHVRKVFFQNPDDEALFRKIGVLHKAVPSVVVSGSGVDVAQFPVAPLRSGPPVFLMIARLLGDKGVREYVAAARIVKARYAGVRFALVGWIDSNPDAITQEELDLWVQQGVVDYLGRLSDVRPAIADCTVCVLPSYREGTPRTVLEGMAMGRPIITTDAPGCRETVVDGENGFLVPVRSAEGLAAAMSRFAEDPGLTGRMGQRSRAIAEEKYDVHKVNAVMLKEMGLA
jgi:glycosyltransferase involved in cell wall biosynthesis